MSSTEPRPVVVDAEKVARGQQVLIRAQRSIIDAVRELHVQSKPGESKPDDGGEAWTHCMEDGFTWPCPTARVVYLEAEWGA